MSINNKENGEIPVTLNDSEEFKKLIIHILSKYALLDISYFDIITNDENMLMFERAFTHPSFNPDNNDNYEFYEFIGDVTVNKSIVWYCHRRFPHLRNEKGVEKFSQMKANLVSKKSLSSLASKLDFWKFIRMSKDTQDRDKRKVLEDVFESFIGCLEMIIDNCINIHSGYGVCYTIISKILDKIKISLDYKDLKDSKTRLKEIYDKSKNFRDLKYIVSTPRSDTNILFGITATGYIDDKYVEMGIGSAPIKRQAEKNAANKAIYFLTKKKYINED
jgi:dsRNA-specific ribonuclease